MTERRRLHISPFTPDLLSTVLSTSLIQRASNISYHSLQTFPDRKYGYVELPAMEAEKIKKKLNGSILKGSKIRVEIARSEKVRKRRVEEDQIDENSTVVKKSRRKQAKPEEGVLPGYELPSDRKVKRGWTESGSKNEKESKVRKDKKDKTKSKPKSSNYINEPECLFKTNVPPNTMRLENTSSKKNIPLKTRRRGVSDRQVLVHEFSNTTKRASFLRDSQGLADKKAVSEYKEGVGWVDQNGNVVDAAPRTRQISKKTSKNNSDDYSRTKTGNANGSRKPPSPGIQISASNGKDADDDETSSSGTSSGPESSSESDKSTSCPAEARARETSPEDTEMTSSSGEESKHEVVTDRVKTISIQRSSATPPPKVEAPLAADKASVQVHPLEALFKRPKNAPSHTPPKPTLEVKTSFNFFDPDADEEENTGPLVPHTPYTQQDIRQRRLRSAAPTPDTAAPGKTFGDLWTGKTDDDESDEDDNERKSETGTFTPTAANIDVTWQGPKEEAPESDFSKWFWEHRGETNRAWKKRRRECAKEKRQRDNKKR